MKKLCAVIAIGIGLVGPALAQPYGYGRDGGYGRDEGYRDRGYRDRDSDRRDYDRRDNDRRDYGRRDDDRRDFGRRDDGRRNAGFDEQEYLRCNPDVRRAVISGQAKSGLQHYRLFGIRENRKLSC